MSQLNYTRISNIFLPEDLVVESGLVFAGVGSFNINSIRSLLSIKLMDLKSVAICGWLLIFSLFLCFLNQPVLVIFSG